MKVGLFVQNTKMGGLDTFVLQLTHAWPTPGELIVFCNRSHPGLEVLHSGLPMGVQLVAYDFLLAHDLYERLRRAPRVLALFCRFTFWVAGFPWQVQQCRKLLGSHRPDRLMVINGGYPGGDACLAATVAWALIAPHARAWHNFHNLALSHPSDLLRRLKERWVDAMVARAAAGFVSVSEACAASLVLARPVFADKPVTGIYHGIASFKAARSRDLREELGLPAQSRIVLMLGVYEPRKGHAFAIGMMASVVQLFPDAWLLACGDGSDEAMRAVEVGRDQSPARGRILLQRHRHDLPNLLAQVDLLIMPSQAQESFGYTVVEAMACSLPVVVSDIGGLPEVASDELTGYVVRHDDADAFAERIVAILSNTVLARRLGEAGRKRYEEKFQAAGMGVKYHHLLTQGTLGNSAPVPPRQDRTFDE